MTKEPVEIEYQGKRLKYITRSLMDEYDNILEAMICQKLLDESYLAQITRLN